MAPKFRGGSDDWLDSSASSKARNARKKAKGGVSPRATALAPEEANGTVAEIFHKQCRVFFDDGRMALCSYRRAAVLGALGEEAGRERSPVAVGDRVLAQVISGQDGVIDGVSTRVRRLVRPAPGRDPGNTHVIASNIDTLCIVASARDPDFNEGLVDRFLVAASREGIHPIICVNKVDLVETAGHTWSAYLGIGYELFEASAKFGRGLEPVKTRLLGCTVAFCGHSGVGKTSLLSALIGQDIGKVGDVSAFTGKGKHTTTGAVLLPLSLTGGPGQTRWIDTPGVKEFGLAGIEAKELAAHFPEFARLACNEHGCEHAGTAQIEGCEAVKLPRHASYRRIYDSLQAGEN